MNIKDCLEKGYLRRIEPDIRIVKKEIKESAYDLERAEDALKQEDFKWCIINVIIQCFIVQKLFFIKKAIKRKNI